MKMALGKIDYVLKKLPRAEYSRFINVNFKKITQRNRLRSFREPTGTK